MPRWADGGGGDGVRGAEVQRGADVRVRGGGNGDVRVARVGVQSPLGVRDGVGETPVGVGDGDETVAFVEGLPIWHAETARVAAGDRKRDGGVVDSHPCARGGHQEKQPGGIVEDAEGALRVGHVRVDARLGDVAARGQAAGEGEIFVRAAGDRRSGDLRQGGAVDLVDAQVGEDLRRGGLPAVGCLGVFGHG